MGQKNNQQLQVALVTGAGKRIGQAMAVALAARGFAVVVHYHRSEKEAKQTVAKINAMGACADLLQCDLTDTLGVQKMIGLAKKMFGRLDVLINCASVFKPSGFDPSDLSALEAHWHVNAKAPFILMAAFAKEIKTGQIINLLDTNIGKTQTTHVGYLLSKKTFAEMTLMAAKDFAPTIRVNGICPGLILPPVHQPKADMQKRAAKLPLKRRGKPQHVVRAMEYLLDNDFVTGELLTVDGGEHLI